MESEGLNEPIQTNDKKVKNWLITIIKSNKNEACTSQSFFEHFILKYALIYHN